MSATPSERLLAVAIPAFESLGYTYRKANHRFRRPLPLGHEDFLLVFDGRGGLVRVSAAILIQCDLLEAHFEAAMGSACPWSAGGTLLNLGAKPCDAYLYDDRFATLTPKQLSAYSSEETHPDSRIQAGLEFLMAARACFAVPLVNRLQTYRDLLAFYEESFTAGSHRGRPLRNNTLLLATILADAFRTPRPALDPTWASVQKLVAYLAAADLTDLQR